MRGRAPQSSDRGDWPPRAGDSGHHTADRNGYGSPDAHRGLDDYNGLDDNGLDDYEDFDDYDVVEADDEYDIIDAEVDHEFVDHEFVDAEAERRATARHDIGVYGDGVYRDDAYDRDAYGGDAYDDRRVSHAQSHQPLRAQWDPTSREVRGSRQPRPHRNVRKQSRIGRFVSAYGWRAYAIPLLLIVTVLVVSDAVPGVREWGTTNGGPADPEVAQVLPGSDGDGSGDAGGGDAVGVAPGADGKFADTLASGALPDGGPFTSVGAGTWRVVGGTTEQVGQGTDHVYTYTVEIEGGIDTSGFGGDESFGRMVDQTLSNPKSWTKDARFAFRRVDQGEPDFRVSLTSQMTIREKCGYDIQLEVSCYNPGVGRVLLNEPRWVRGAVAFQGDIGSYRQYQINHEVGHAIGYREHQPCQVDGGLAPVMMQQSFGTADDDIARLDPGGPVPMDGRTCRFNPWPFPLG